MRERVDRELPSGQYGFGSYTIMLVIDGEFDRPADAADHIAAFASAATLLECIRCFVIDEDRWGEGSVNETISTKIVVNGSTLELSVEFKLSRGDIEKEFLEKIVSSMVLPMAQQAMGFYLHGEDPLIAAPDETSLATALGDTTRIDRALRSHEMLVGSDAGSSARHATPTRRTTKQ